MKVLITCNLKDDNKEKLSQSFNDIEFIYCKANELTQSIADDCDIIVGTPSHVNLNRPTLKALLLNSAGSDTYVKEGVLHENTLLANASGSYGIAIAEHAIGMIIALNKGFKHFVLNMEKGIWHKNLNDKEIYNSHVLIVGLGDLGYEIAKRLKSFNCHITGVKRRISDIPECVDELYIIDDLDKLLPDADYVVLCLPHSNETYHMFNKEKLMLMKKDAVIVNVGRGSAIDTNDLIDVLNNNHLYGAALDVVEEEPLNDQCPLWYMDNVFITPHASGGFKWNSVRNYFVDLTIRNLHHIINNEPLENEVDFITGYRKDVRYK